MALSHDFLLFSGFDSLYVAADFLNDSLTFSGFNFRYDVIDSLDDSLARVESLPGQGIHRA